MNNIKTTDQADEFAAKLAGAEIHIPTNVSIVIDLTPAEIAVFVDGRYDYNLNSTIEYNSMYGVKFLIKPDVERELWLNTSLQGLERAYGEDEPDYDDAPGEINPDYNPD